MNEAANCGGPHHLESFPRLWRLENGVREFYPFSRHFALNGAIFPIWCRRHRLQTMLRVARVLFVKKPLTEAAYIGKKLA